MPRQGVSTRSQNKKFEEFEQHVDVDPENSTSSGSFQSVTQDPNQTDYNLTATDVDERSLRGRPRKRRNEDVDDNDTSPKRPKRIATNEKASTSKDNPSTQASKNADPQTASTSKAPVVQNPSPRSRKNKDPKRLPPPATNTSSSTSNNVFKVPYPPKAPARPAQQRPAQQRTTQQRPAQQRPTQQRPTQQRQGPSRQTAAQTQKQSKPQYMRDAFKLQARFQSGVAMIPKSPFSRLVREIIASMAFADMRVTPDCLLCLQTAAEIYLTQMFEDAHKCTLHAKRKTLMVPDLKLVQSLRKE